jgi:iron transport multicopper oxidase
MALSLSNFLYAICALSTLSYADTVTYDWNVTWVNANPDGQFERRTMGINGQWYAVEYLLLGCIASCARPRATC